MSFFKKLTNEIKELIGDKDEKSKDGQVKHDNTYAHNGVNQYGVSAPPSDQQQLPPGWIRQWDQNSQRWYFIEQSSGRSQWEPPQPGHGAVPYQQHPPPNGAPYQQHPSGGAFYQQHPPEGGPYPHYNQSATYDHTRSAQMYGHDAKYEQKSKSGKGGMIAAGAGGLAVGALAGAALAGDSSDDEHGHAYQAGPGPGNYYGAPAPVPLEQNPELSSSQRSSLQEAREDYEQAQREVAADSDPDSSDIEELQEAREEYHSEVESAHEELED